MRVSTFHLDELRPLIEEHITITNFPEIFASLDSDEKTKVLIAIDVCTEKRKWIDGRANLPIWSVFPPKIEEELLWRILFKAKFTAKGGNSKMAVFLPFVMTEDFAYFFGVLAGDGHIAKPKPYQRSWWTIQMCEDDLCYQREVYIKIVKRIFGYTPKIGVNCRKDGRKNVFSRIHSFIIVIFLTKVLGIKNGYKVDSVSMPDKIRLHKDIRIRCAYIRGLFDTDGTVTGGIVKFSTVSPCLFTQTERTLKESGIHYTKSEWLKNENSRLLYTISIPKKGLLKFNEIVGFKNFRKKEKLRQLIAPSSSGQG